MRFRSLGVLCGATAGLLLFAGCGKRESQVAEGDRTQTLLVGNLIEPPDLDPQLVDDDRTQQLIMSIAEGLAQYDVKTCLPVPAVAESWEHNPDCTQWTFRLRPDARWSDGRPLTARDFVYAYRRLLSPGLAAEYAYMLFNLKNGQAFYTGKIRDFGQVGVHASGDQTLVMDLDHPVPYLDKLVCHPAWYPVPQAAIEKFGKIDDRGTRWTRPGNFVGNGPFDLVEWKAHQIIRVVKSPTYWNRDHIRLNEVDFLPIEDNATEEAMFRRGQLHVTATMPQDKIPVYKNDPKLRRYLDQTTMLCTYFYAYNVTKPPLDNPQVRRALSEAIDRKEIVERVALGGQPPAGHLTPPNTAGFTATANIPSDPELARQELAKAGFPGGKGFPRFELLYNTSEGHRQIAEAIQQMWKRELGVEVTLRNVEGKVWSESMREGNFQIARYSWVGDYVDPSTFLDLMLSDDGNNYGHWKNAEYDRLVSAGDREPDQVRRFADYQRAEEILVDQSPLIPIYFYTRNNLRVPELKGWYGNLLDEHAFTDVYLETPAQ